jgi:hypothetical protein
MKSAKGVSSAMRVLPLKELRRAGRSICSRQRTPFGYTRWFESKSN